MQLTPFWGNGLVVGMPHNEGQNFILPFFLFSSRSEFSKIIFKNLIKIYEKTLIFIISNIYNMKIYLMIILVI
jgi:hypothetical protein